MTNALERLTFEHRAEPPRVPPAARAYLGLIVAAFLGHGGSFYVSQSEVARVLGVSIRTVRAWERLLVEAGVVVRRDHGRGRQLSLAKSGSTPEAGILSQGEDTGSTLPQSAPRHRKPHVTTQEAGFPRSKEERRADDNGLAPESPLSASSDDPEYLRIRLEAIEQGGSTAQCARNDLTALGLTVEEARTRLDALEGRP